MSVGWLRRLRVLVLLLVATSASVFALEAATRIAGIHFPALSKAGDGERGLWVYHPLMGWLNKPASQGISFLGGPDRGQVRTNALGLRGREVVRPKPPGARRVLVFGDSFVFGVGVDDDHVFTARLEALLNDASPTRFEVVNMGVSGYSSDQELLLLEDLGTRLEPDLVILIGCDNDFEGNTIDFTYGRYPKPYFELESDGRLVRRNVPVPLLTRAQQARLWLGQRSNVWNAFRSMRSGFAPIQGLLDLFQVGHARRASVDPVRLMTALVLSFRDLATAAGARFAFFNTGHRNEETPLFQALRPALRQHGILFLGLEGSLSEARRSAPERRWDFGTDPHWNVDAHALTAEIVHAYLQKVGLL